MQSPKKAALCPECKTERVSSGLYCQHCGNRTCVNCVWKCSMCEKLHCRGCILSSSGYKHWKCFVCDVQMCSKCAFWCSYCTQMVCGQHAVNAIPGTNELHCKKCSHEFTYKTQPEPTPLPPCSIEPREDAALGSKLYHAARDEFELSLQATLLQTSSPTKWWTLELSCNSPHYFVTIEFRLPFLFSLSEWHNVLTDKPAALCVHDEDVLRCTQDQCIVRVKGDLFRKQEKNVGWIAFPKPLLQTVLQPFLEELVQNNYYFAPDLQQDQEPQEE